MYRPEPSGSSALVFALQVSPCLIGLRQRKQRLGFPFLTPTPKLVNADLVRLMTLRVAVLVLPFTFHLAKGFRFDKA